MMRVIGEHFEIPSDDGALLGKGGMGTVFLGRDTRANTQVAIKQLKASIILESQDFVERFTREAEALGRLNHPSIVKVLEFIEEDDGHYLIMEYVSGGSLEDLLEETPVLSVERVLEIALDLADALTRAHRLKIIHRDIKPANVLLAEDGTPRLTDFGVARMDDKTRVTQTGAVVGTLSYLSPEALNGDILDERTDIWAFGVMLFEMLSGQRPFDDDSTTSLITSILTKEAPDLNELRPDLPAALVNLITQMLQKDKDMRIDSVRKVGTELENVIRGADSDEIDISHSVVDIVREGRSRFSGGTTPHGENIRSKHGLTTFQSETGESYVVMPQRFATKVKRTVAVVVVVLIVVVIMLSGALKEGHTEVENVQATHTAMVDTNSGVPVFSPDEIADDDYVVLVMSRKQEEEELGTGSSLRPIMQKLMETLERNIPFSNIRVIPYQSDVSGQEPGRAGFEGMQQAISMYNPGVVVSLDERSDGKITATIQIGNLEAFPYNTFDRAVLERMVNVEIELTDPETQSLAPYVLSAMAVLHTADGNLAEVMRTLTMLAEVDSHSAEVTSNGVNTYLYAYFSNYLTDTEAAVAAMDAALEIDGGNPILYTYRGMAKSRLANSEDAQRDMTTAGRIGPENWVMPLLVFSGPDVIKLETINQAIAARPDDWLLYTFRAEYYFFLGDYDAVLTDVDLAVANNPQTNMPYIMGFLSSLHLGRLADAGTLMKEMIHKFPDPNFSRRVFDAVYGETGELGGMLYSSVANLIVGQYDVTIDDTAMLIGFIESPEIQAMILDADAEMGVGMADTAADLFLIRGLAYCNLGDMDAAMASYQTGIALSPDYHLLHLLASEVYAERGDMVEAEASGMAALGLSDEFDTFVMAASVEGDERIGCRNFFENLMDRAE